MTRSETAQSCKTNRKRRDELIRIGSMMSNMLYNIKQWPEIPEIVRTTAKELQEEWDGVKYGK